MKQNITEILLERAEKASDSETALQWTQTAINAAQVQYMQIQMEHLSLDIKRIRNSMDP